MKDKIKLFRKNMIIKNISILVIDDHPLMGHSFKQIIRQMGKITIDCVLDAVMALEKLAEKTYDLIILDINLPLISGQTLLQLIRSRKISTPVLAISGTTKTSDIVWMLEHGSQGFVSKTEKAGIIKSAIYHVLNGEQVIPSNLQSIQNKENKNKNNVADHIGITPKQLKVLQLIKQGLGNKQIAHELHVAESTVSSHLKQIYSTLKVHNRTECVNYAKNLGII